MAQDENQKPRKLNELSAAVRHFIIEGSQLYILVLYGNNLFDIEHWASSQ